MLNTNEGQEANPLSWAELRVHQSTSKQETVSAKTQIEEVLEWVDRVGIPRDNIIFSCNELDHWYK